MSIIDIKVTRLPEFNNGANWDLADEPDLNIDLKLENNVIWTSSEIIENLVSLNQKSVVQPQLVIDSINANYTFTLFDVDDQNTREIMGAVTFKPWDGTFNKPTVISLDSGGEVALRILVRYNY
jgi:hypothetical protein